MEKFFIFLLFYQICALNDVRVQIGTDYYHNQNIKGQNVICGIIDDIDITFNDFRDPVTHETRVLAYKRYYEDNQGNGKWDIWDKDRIDSLLNAKYPYDSYHEYDSSSIFHNKQNDHGTIIANIMAGNGTSVRSDGSSQSNLVGIAPRSKLVIVSKPNDSSLYFIDSVAGSHEMPWVTNISWTTGPEDEISELTGHNKPGKIVVAAAGNNNFENYKKIGFTSTDTLYNFHFPFENFETNSFQNGPFTIYYYLTSFNLISDYLDEYIVRFTTQYGEIVEFDENDYMVNDSVYYLRGSSGTSVQEYFKVFKYLDHKEFTFYAQTNSENDWDIDIIRKDMIYSDSLEFAFSWKNEQYSYAVMPSETFDKSKYTMLNFAMMDEIITVAGNYHTNLGEPEAMAGDICSYSGVGPAFDLDIKPDITAPAHGMTVLAVHPENDIVGSVWFGTSFSSPLVAGAAALLLQEDPTRDVNDIKNIFYSRAKSNEYTSSLPNNIWGYGILNLDPNNIGISKPTYSQKMNIQKIDLFPNPFNPSTKIVLNIDLAQINIKAASLKIFDINGKLIDNLTPFINKCITKGHVWKSKKSSSSVYILKFISDNITLSKKMVFIK